MNNKTTFGIVAAIVASTIILSFYFLNREKKEHREKEAIILIEQIRAVNQLITVEARFSELYTYRDYKRFNWKPFQKKAILRIQGKVLAGVDLSAITIEPDPARKVIEIGPLPKAKVLAVEQVIDYYDLNAGVFNTFKTDDHNRMQQDAKDILIQKASESNILKEADTRCMDILNRLKNAASSAGWTLEVKA